MRQLIAACIALALAAAAPALDVGSRLPALGDVAWVGDPADPTGAFAIVDLWSPDNPACRAIMPRLTDLQRRHPEVRIIGLTTADRATTANFVGGMGSRVGYAIGVVPSLAPFSPPVGLPVALLVDRSGTVLWWGDAMDIAVPLAQALNGTFVPAPPPPPVIVRPPADDPLPSAAPPAVQAPVQVVPQSTIERRRSSTVVVIADPWCWPIDGWCPRPGRIYVPRPPAIFLPPLPPPPLFYFHHHR